MKGETLLDLGRGTAGNMPGIIRAGSKVRRLGDAVFVVAPASMSDKLQFVTFDPYRNRAVDRIDRNHQALMPGFFQDSLEAVQTTAANAYPLPNLKKRMQRKWHILR